MWGGGSLEALLEGLPCTSPHIQLAGCCCLVLPPGCHQAPLGGWLRVLLGAAAARACLLCTLPHVQFVGRVGGCMGGVGCSSPAPCMPLSAMRPAPFLDSGQRRALLPAARALLPASCHASLTPASLPPCLPSAVLIGSGRRSLGALLVPTPETLDMVSTDDGGSNGGGDQALKRLLEVSPPAACLFVGGWGVFSH